MYTTQYTFYTEAHGGNITFKCTVNWKEDGVGDRWADFQGNSLASVKSRALRFINDHKTAVKKVNILNKLVDAPLAETCSFQDCHRSGRKRWLP